MLSALKFALKFELGILPSFAFFAVQVCSAFTVRVHSLFTVRVRVRLEATLPCFKLCDQPARST
ncbi:hypothetical protein Ahy_A01g004831 isoform G [Arachis hypogaea]|uniref:Uncharacterized protein n=1 Tax=Arachis hypogaea TaxID=3818 RepID=A0A445EXC2_ARAHY|nr:hypothetical protein Ahy_A01g004831 isoform G [Arachis hypogaea]